MTPRTCDPEGREARRRLRAPIYVVEIRHADRHWCCADRLLAKLMTRDNPGFYTRPLAEWGWSSPTDGRVAWAKPGQPSPWRSA